MLHEILLGLSGHPSPLLRTDRTSADGSWPISPAERELLGSVAHLSDVHIKLLSSTAQISSSHPSTICRAVASAIDSIHLRAFQRKVLEVEESILRNDAGLVGAYNIVPLTAVVGEFSGWTRRMDWLWALVQFMLRQERTKDEGAAATCTGARIINRLRKELQTGYVDVEETARGLVQVAEIAWLKQVSAWILYGRLPSFGQDDFFVQRCDDGDEEYECIPSLQPAFVTTPTALSMLFIGRSLIHIRAKSRMDGSLPGTHHLSSQLNELSKLTYPLDGATFSRTITSIRLFLSRTALQKLLPQSKVLEMLQLLRDFFLLGRGDFAMALTQQADQKIRSRWRRADNLAYEKREGLANVTVKEGEAAAVLAATWAALGSWQGQHSDEDEGLEMARGLLQLSLAKPDHQQTPLKPGPRTISSTPFRNLLFSVPVTLTMQIPSPIDLFLSPSDLQMYTVINSYLVSIRRAHIRLTDLWKISPLRRHHPPPPAPPYGSSRNGRAKVLVLRERHLSRSNEMRSAWATCSAAIFFLAETEAYLQTEVVAGLWDGFQRWLTKGTDDSRSDELQASQKETAQPTDDEDEDGEDIWLTTATSKLNISESGQAHEEGRDTQASHQHKHHHHDPQTLTAAHRLYLGSLVHRLLLTQQSFTDALYELLVHIDHLIALVHRLHGIWTSIDLEADAGVVDAFVDLEREERDVKREIKAVEARVRKGVQGTVELLRSLEGSAFLGGDSGLDGVGNEIAGEEGAMELREFGEYVPRRVGGLDRLLMKLDFGSWFDSGRREDRGLDDDDGL